MTVPITVPRISLTCSYLGRSRHGCDFNTLAVSAVQVIAVHVLSPLPRFSEAVLTSQGSQDRDGGTGIAAVVVFAACVH